MRIDSIKWKENVLVTSVLMTYFWNDIKQIYKRRFVSNDQILKKLFQC